MNEYPLHIKNCLLAAISQITARKDEFVKHPGRDFSRNRKISLNRMILFLVGAEASTMQFELQKFSFLFPKSISGLPSCSAMFQRRSRLSGDAMPAVFDEFNKQFPTKLVNGLHLLAVDGTQINIAYDLYEDETQVILNLVPSFYRHSFTRDVRRVYRNKLKPCKRIISQKDGILQLHRGNR